MSLFASNTAEDTKRACALIEQTLRAFGVDPTNARLPDVGDTVQFGLRRGSATIVISVGPSAGATVLRIAAPVASVPSGESRIGFFIRLLEANAREFGGFAFGLIRGEVVLVGERNVLDLDASEVEALVRSIGKAADHYDDALASEFGVARAADRR